MKSIGRETLDSAPCDTCGDSCKKRDEHVMGIYCKEHPKVGTVALYFKGVLGLICRECEDVVCNITVATLN